MICRVFKHVFKKGFGLAFADIAQQLENGKSPEQLHLDVTGRTVRDKSVEWIFKAWAHCLDMQKSIVAGYR